MKLAIIGDIAGQFNGLIELVRKIPSDHEIILLGDLVDRGPDSKKVVQWIIDNKVRSVYGNHEDLMIKADGLGQSVTHESQIWMMNGGYATLKSYVGDHVSLDKHIGFLKTLPRLLKIEIDIPGFNSVLISHAPIHHKYRPNFNEQELVEDANALSFSKLSESIIWNRNYPRRRVSLQVTGHNSQWGYREFKDDAGVFAYSIDQSQKELLTCLLIPEMTIIEQEYVSTLTSNFNSESSDAVL